MKQEIAKISDDLLINEDQVVGWHENTIRNI